MKRFWLMMICPLVALALLTGCKGDEPVDGEPEEKPETPDDTTEYIPVASPNQLS